MYMYADLSWILFFLKTQLLPFTGFHLSGEVAPPPGGSSSASPTMPAGYTSLVDIDKTYKVSLSFDR